MSEDIDGAEDADEEGEEDYDSEEGDRDDEKDENGENEQHNKRSQIELDSSRSDDEDNDENYENAENEENEEDDDIEETKETEETEDDCVFLGKVFRIEGSKINLIRPRSKLLFFDDHLTLEDIDTDVGGRHAGGSSIVWAYEQIMSVRQYRPTTCQFLWRERGDQIEEFGVHFDSSREARDFRTELLASIHATCDDLILRTRVTIEILNVRSKLFIPLHKHRLMTLNRRTSDRTALLTVWSESTLEANDDEDGNEDGDDKDGDNDSNRGKKAIEERAVVEGMAPLFQTELIRDVQLYCAAPHTRQFTVWGPYIGLPPESSSVPSNDGAASSGEAGDSSYARAMLRFTVESGSECQVAETFAILKKLDACEDFVLNQLFEYTNDEEEDSVSITYVEDEDDVGGVKNDENIENHGSLGEKSVSEERLAEQHLEGQHHLEEHGMGDIESIDEHDDDRDRVEHQEATRPKNRALTSEELLNADIETLESIDMQLTGTKTLQKPASETAAIKLAIDAAQVLKRARPKRGSIRLDRVGWDETENLKTESEPHYCPQYYRDIVGSEIDSTGGLHDQPEESHGHAGESHTHTGGAHYCAGSSVPSESVRVWERDMDQVAENEMVEGFESNKITDGDFGQERSPCFGGSISEEESSGGRDSGGRRRLLHWSAEGGESDEDKDGDNDGDGEKDRVYGRRGRSRRDSLQQTVRSLDPSLSIIEKDPSKKLHRFMQTGLERSFVCRSRAQKGTLFGGDLVEEDEEQGGGLSVAVGGKEGRKEDFDLHVYKNGGGQRSRGGAGGGMEKGGVIGAKKFVTASGTALAPLRGILHDGDSKLAFVDEKKGDKLYYMDLNAEKIVAEFDGRSIAPELIWESRKAQGGASRRDPTFMCANSKALFTIDTRTQKREATLEYKSTPAFTAAASDAQGHILLASATGAFRLYDGQPSTASPSKSNIDSKSGIELNVDKENVRTRGSRARAAAKTASTVGATATTIKAEPERKLKVAKTQLEGGYEHIKAVDVTGDGSWILGTMKSALVLFPVKLKSTGKTGFETRLGAKKPPAIYLRLTNEDIAYYGLEDINFAPAVFDHDDRAILTSTGNLAIVWDMRLIKRGFLNSYKIKVASQYIKGTASLADGSVVLAHPTHIDKIRTTRIVENFPI